MSFLHIGSYNVDVAKSVGVNSAILLSCINGKLFYEASSSDVTKIPLARNDIYNMTGIDNDIQERSEQSLTESGILRVIPFKGVKDKNYYSINYNRLNEVISHKSLSSEILENSQEEIREKKKQVPKRVQQMNQLKSMVDIADTDIRQLFCDWIDSVYANPKGFIPSQGLKLSMNDLMKYGTRDDIINVLRIAIKNGWKDFTWAINQYEKSSKSTNDYNFCDYDAIKSDGKSIVEEEF